MRICIVGNPENRRVREYIAQAVELGMPAPECVGWIELLSQEPSEVDSAIKRISAADHVRIESAGENAAVQRQLIQLGGGGESQLAVGEIGCLQEQYLGFCKALELLNQASVSFMNSPTEIKVMFDKWQSHQRFEVAGIKRPATEVIPTDVDISEYLIRRFGANGRVFIKPRFASSASGVCAYRWAERRQQLIAPIELERKLGSVRLFNSLRVRKYTSPQDIVAIFEGLLPQGLICESWVSKARLPDGNFDLRIVVIDGEARHTVVRQSHFPMTNLHLGNRRGKLVEVEDVFGSQVVRQAAKVAETAAICFPGSLYAGVDVLVPQRGEPMVCEINAFGDLLPNVWHQGETTYEAILKAANVLSNFV